MVLDVGCSTGLLGEKLIKTKQCKVFGIDISKNAINEAKNRLQKAAVMDIEKGEYPFSDELFDVIIFADILEHLMCPGEILKKFQKYLALDGIFIISLPNVANIRIRLRLLLGIWNYTKSGILDDTHLRFFTKASAMKLFNDLGFRVVNITSTPGFDFFVGDHTSTQMLIAWLCKRYPKMFANQFIFTLRPINSD